jgi:hypothetical protein
MSKSIVITFPHQLGTDEAKRRITTQVEESKKAYIDKIGSGELIWEGDTGHIRVSALGQTTTATVDVKPDDIRVEIHLPWLLAAFANKIEALVKSDTNSALRLEPPKKV